MVVGPPSPHFESSGEALAMRGEGTHCSHREVCLMCARIATSFDAILRREPAMSGIGAPPSQGAGLCAQAWPPGSPGRTWVVGAGASGCD